MSNYLVLVNNLSLINKYKELGYTNFLFALEDFSIGYETFKTQDIPSDSYILVNRILDSNEIRVLEDILVKSSIKGIVFEDLGILTIAKKNNLNIDLIYFHNHAGTNYETINFWLNEGVNSVVLSNELTKEEIKEITLKVNKPVSIIIWGHNQVMYSRRKLLTNYSLYHHIPYEKVLNLDTNNHYFIAVESEYGTVFYTKDIYNYFALNDLDFYQKIIIQRKIIHLLNKII